jgi:hypothetical protein
MTQLIGVVTSEHALLVSDRRLTYGPGPRCGQLYNDDTCKLVNVANSCGIAYTGLAHIGAQPTHEWIADVIAAENCNHGSVAVQILSRRAAEVFRGIDAAIARQIFLMAAGRCSTGI